MFREDVRAAGEVGDCTGELDDSGTGSGGEPQICDYSFKHKLALTA